VSNWSFPNICEQCRHAGICPAPAVVQNPPPDQRKGYYALQVLLQVYVWRKLIVNERADITVHRVAAAASHSRPGQSKPERQLRRARSNGPMISTRSPRSPADIPFRGVFGRAAAQKCQPLRHHQIVAQGQFTSLILGFAVTEALGISPAAIVRALTAGRTERRTMHRNCMAEQFATLEKTPPSEQGAKFPPFDRSTFGSQLIWLAIFLGLHPRFTLRAATGRIGARHGACPHRGGLRRRATLERRGCRRGRSLRKSYGRCRSRPR
jgi:hypothetical protein